MSKTPFEVTRRVEFHETDLAGIVHFANFFRYMEAAEHEFLRSLGHHIHGKTNGLETGWPRVNATCDYRRPARFGDLLTIRVTIAEVRTRSVRYAFEFLAEGETLATGSLTAAHVELAGEEIKAVPIPDDLRAELGAYVTETK